MNSEEISKGRPVSEGRDQRYAGRFTIIRETSSLARSKSWYKVHVFPFNSASTPPLPPAPDKKKKKKIQEEAICATLDLKSQYVVHKYYGTCMTQISALLLGRPWRTLRHS